MLRRVQIQADRIGGLRLEVGIVGGQISFQSVRLETVLCPHPRDPHIAVTKLDREFPCALVG